MMHAHENIYLAHLQEQKERAFRKWSDSGYESLEAWLEFMKWYRKCQRPALSPLWKEYYHANR